ncbi:MAG: hypothetical protein GVY30_01840 [Chloroflexi bacterium]|jgi:uncharacterized membrane protein|nr:hypothetical protein [Chloroflexota bacterium]
MEKYRTRKLLIVAGLALLLVALAVPGARAFEGRGGDVVVIEADEVIEDDLYVAAGEFILMGTVRGDVIAVGSSVIIEGTVTGDLLAGGQSVAIEGTVEDDARIAGYALSLEGEVGDDVIATGYSLQSRSDAVIGGDVLYAGYQTLLAGMIGGNVEVGGGAVQISGEVAGDAKVDVGGAEAGDRMPPGFPYMPTMPRVSSVPSGLTVTEDASISGNLTYTATTEVDMLGDVVAGETDFNQYDPEEKEGKRGPGGYVGRWFLRQIRRLIIFLLIGAVMMGLIPDWTRKMAQRSETEPLLSLGWGVVALVAFGVLMVALVAATALLAGVFGLITLGELAGRFAVLGGLLTGAVGFSFSLLWRYVTAIIFSVLAGRLTFRVFHSSAESQRWLPMLVGVIIFVIITAVPILGWIAKLGVGLLSLGAIWLWGLDWWKQRQAAPVGAEA